VGKVDIALNKAYTAATFQIPTNELSSMTPSHIRCLELSMFGTPVDKSPLSPTTELLRTQTTRHIHKRSHTVAEKRFEVELLEEVLAGFGWQESDVPRRVREALVMELLRRDQLSEAQAAALLQLDRWGLLDVMGRYQVPAIRMTAEELKRELAQDIRRNRAL
jgi:hypothetical protein